MRVRSLLPLFLLAACTTEEAPHDDPGGATTASLNTVCPMMGEDVDPAVKVAYQDGEVAFCCEGCIDDWNALSPEEAAAKLAALD